MPIGCDEYRYRSLATKFQKWTYKFCFWDAICSIQCIFSFYCSRQNSHNVECCQYTTTVIFQHTRYQLRAPHAFFSPLGYFGCWYQVPMVPVFSDFLFFNKDKALWQQCTNLQNNGRWFIFHFLIVYDLSQKLYYVCSLMCPIACDETKEKDMISKTKKKEDECHVEKNFYFMRGKCCTS